MSISRQFGDYHDQAHQIDAEADSLAQQYMQIKGEHDDIFYGPKKRKPEVKLAKMREKLNTLADKHTKLRSDFSALNTGGAVTLGSRGDQKPMRCTQCSNPFNGIRYTLRKV